MERLIKGIVILGVFTLVTLNGVATSTQAAGPEVILRYAGNLTVDHHLTENQRFFAKLVMERTNGKVEVQVFPAAQLFSDKDLPKALPAGAVEMGLATMEFWHGLVPSFVFLNLPFLVDSFPYQHRVLESEVSEILKEDLLKRAGVRLLYWAYYGGGCFISKKPLRTLEDFKGQRIRSLGETMSVMISCLGAVPTALGGGEVYMGLQRGIIDGAITPIGAVPKRKDYEVTKHITYPYLSIAIVGALINEKIWNSLSSDVQKIMLEAAKAAEIKSFNDAQKADEEALAVAKEKGMEINTPSEEEKARWKKACKELFDLPVKRAGETGRVLLERTEKLR